MKRTLATLFLAAAVAGTAVAQTPARDSLHAERNYEIGEVVVTGTRLATDVRHLSQTVSVVDRARIEAAR